MAAALLLVAVVALAAIGTAIGLARELRTTRALMRDLDRRLAYYRSVETLNRYLEGR